MLSDNSSSQLRKEKQTRSNYTTRSPCIYTYVAQANDWRFASNRPLFSFTDVDRRVCRDRHLGPDIGTTFQKPFLCLRDG